jgi:NFU1 iron-sulfur cluster scaffold homolog, mitochondrial
MAIEVRAESTPNPNSLKFVVNQTVSTSTQWFANAAAAANQPLAAAIFALGPIVNVMLLNNFITVGKAPDASWEDLQGAIIALIEEKLA